MINALVHALSNRQTGFVTPELAVSSLFAPKVMTADEQQLRTLLLLDQTGTDFYLKRYLALVHAFPDLLTNLDISQRTYDPSRFNFRVTRIAGARFSLGSTLSAEASGIPQGLTWQLQYQSEQSARLRNLETGVSKSVGVQVVNGQLRILDAAALALQGTLQLEQDWRTGAQVTIYHEPAGLDWSTLLSRVSGNYLLISWLRQADLLDQFHSDHQPEERCALALATVARNNTAVYES